MPVLSGRKVLLGVTGGIAAYKAPMLVRELQAAGATVRCVMTEAAKAFVSSLALQVLSQQTVGTDLFDHQYEAQIGHIEIARWPDVVVVAPATANTCGKLAHGLADNLLSTVLLATRAPVVIAPAMNTAMWEHPSVQENLASLRSRPQFHVVRPDSGDLACQEVGVGRQPDPEVLIDAVLEALSPQFLAGKRVLVTLGPTREHIDPVRFFSNASSGKMGFAICAAAKQHGADVVAVAGPVTAKAPRDVEVYPATTAVEMMTVTDQLLQRGVDIAVFVAAVADIRPESAGETKIRKADLGTSLRFVPNPDVLATVAGRKDRPFCVGFAAEMQDVVNRAQEKCRRKGADLIVANDVTVGGFGTEDNTVTLLSPDQVLGRIGPASKLTVARALWAHIHDYRQIATTPRVKE